MLTTIRTAGITSVVLMRTDTVLPTVTSPWAASPTVVN